MDADVVPEMENAVVTEDVHPLRYFLWRRPFARALWIACAAFWGGAGLSLFIGALSPVFENAAAGLLYSILFPPLVCLYLLMGWLRQEIDADRIALRPSPPTSTRSISGFSDPMADAYDARSPLYSERIEELHKRLQ